MARRLLPTAAWSHTTGRGTPTRWSPPSCSAGYLGLVPLPAPLLGALAAITALYVAAAEWLKRRFYGGESSSSSTAASSSTFTGLVR